MSYTCIGVLGKRVYFKDKYLNLVLVIIYYQLLFGKGTYLYIYWVLVYNKE